MNKALVFKIILILLLLTGITIFGSKAWKDYQVEQDQQKMQAMFSQILEGASTEPPAIKIDYKKQLATGSPLIFGGNHGPELSHQDAWDKIAEIGITSIRKDMFVESPLPPTTTIESYKNNVGDIQNPENWYPTHIKNTKSFYENAQRRGMKTIGIVAYSPSWLNYTNSVWAVPKDMEIYEDLVKKTYKLYRNNLDYVEIWNEPNFDFFFNTENSGMTKDEAYHKLFYHAAKAIREVDSEMNDGKIIPILGPAGYDPIKTSTIETILADPKTRDQLQIVTYHNYDAKHLKEPSWINYKKVMEKYGKQDLPVFITEWNYEPDSTATSTKHTSNEAITYVGNKFIDFLKMGLAGANYHVIEQLDLMKPDEGEGYMGFYRFKNHTAELLPQSKTWRLMSNKMKLGKGDSTIYQLDTADIEVNGIGFRNFEGQYGFVVTNNSSSSKATRVNLSNLGIDQYANVEIFYASADNDATTPVYSGEIKREKNGLELVVYLPEEAVIGVLLSEEKTWFDFVNLPY